MAREFRGLCERHRIAQSTGRTGSSHDNAVRLHSSLGNVPPIEWELRFAHRDLLAA